MKKQIEKQWRQAELSTQPMFCLRQMKFKEHEEQLSSQREELNKLRLELVAVKVSLWGDSLHFH